jgi:hypothetical protein
MIARITTVVAALTLAACSSNGTVIARLGNDMPANPVTQATVQPAVLTAKERLVAAIEANNCSLTADNVGAVLSQATISREELVQLTPQLQAEGRVETSGNGSIHVLSDRCI